MTPLQNLHYAIGEIAYAIAKADGNIQKEEKEKFHAIVAAELRCKDYDFDISDIIFQILEKDKIDAATSYAWAMNQLRLNSHYLSPELKKKFTTVAEKVAKAFPPIADSELRMIERFNEDIKSLHGDPVYYAKKLKKV